METDTLPPYAIPEVSESDAEKLGFDFVALVRVDDRCNVLITSKKEPGIYITQNVKLSEFRSESTRPYGITILQNFGDWRSFLYLFEQKRPKGAVTEIGGLYNPTGPQPFLLHPLDEDSAKGFDFDFVALVREDDLGLTSGTTFFRVFTAKKGEKFFSISKEPIRLSYKAGTAFSDGQSVQTKEDWKRFVEMYANREVAKAKIRR